MKNTIKLKRELSFLQVVFIGIGIILRAGIYVLVGEAAGTAGNSVWLSFFIAALVSIFTGLSYAELSSMFPKAGAEYVYTKRAFGRRISFIVGWMIIAGGSIAAATVALGFASYFSALFAVPVLPAAIALLLVCFSINFYGIKQSAFVATLFAIIETGGLILIILLGLPHLGSVDYFQMQNGFGGVVAAASLIFFAFIGFEEMVRLSEETKNPTKTIPRALVAAVIISAVLYAMVAISVVSLLPIDRLSASKSPLADAAATVIGSGNGWIIAVIALFATSNTVLVIILSTSRITYGMASTRALPRKFSLIHKQRRTPWMAISLVTLLAIVFVFAGDIKVVAEATNFSIFVTYILINLTLIYFRLKKPKARRPFKVPLSIGGVPLLPIFGIITCVLLMLSISAASAVYGLAMLASGIIFYELYRKR